MKPTKTSSFAFLFILFSFLLSAQNTTPEVVEKPAEQIIVIDSITTITGEKVSRIKLGKTYTAFSNYNNPDRTIYVYVDNIRIDSLVANQGHNFHFTVRNQDLDTKLPLDSILAEAKSDNAVVNLTFGYTSKETIENSFNVELDFIRTKDKLAGYIILFAALIIFFITAWTLMNDNKKILRDNGTDVKIAPFSLARTQMAFWTIIILISILWIWYKSGEFVAITTQVLILLGISAGTTVTANLIDKSDLENPKIKKRLQDSDQEKDKKGFFENIVSDQKGLSIHRFQNVIFSLAIGLYFLYEVFKNQKIPTLNEELMVMMGISSGTYLAIKKGENSSAQADEDAKDEVRKAKEKEAAEAQKESTTKATDQSQID